MKLLPKQKEARHVELEDLKRRFPDTDWERLVPDYRTANPEWY